ncbi:class I SAM-dependent methyltransferase [Chloroflexota bacterium]
MSLNSNENRAITIIQPVYRTKDEARQFYNRISNIYDFLAGTFERKYAIRCLEYLNVQIGESLLEIGFGTGEILRKIVQLVGDEGKAYGIDISDGMLELTKKKLVKTDLIDRVKLICGDAVNLPFADNSFDAVFTSFTLELFDTPEIHKVLQEVRRVLKKDGRFGIVSLSKSYENSMSLRAYEWFHRHMPTYFDCRPIYVADSLKEVGFTINVIEKASLVGLPLEIVVANKA